MITTVNYHLLKACNFNCKYCYATFNDIKTKEMFKAEQFELISQLAKSKKFRKINFAGGEPTLVPHIKELIKHAKSLGFETSIVTNASNIDFEWVKSISSYLDILTLSIDSLKLESNINSGRNQSGNTISENTFVEVAKACHFHGVSLKINTVVSQFNQDDSLTNLINELNPFRWKILQATRVEGQNNEQFENVQILSDMFRLFCARNKEELNLSVKVIEEADTLIQGSYLMIDMLGRFFDSSQSKHSYSEPILKVGVLNALNQVSVDSIKYSKREANYSVLTKKAA